MDQALQVFGAAVQGLRTNFWGLGCPKFCGDFPLSFFLLSLLVGWIAGILTGIWICHHHLVIFSSTPQTLQPSSVVTASQRLAGYLYESGPRSRRRG